MLRIAIIVGLTLFFDIAAIYNYYQNDEIAISRRIARQFAKTGGKSAKSTGDFWTEIANSPVNTWAQKIVEHFGGFLPQREWFDLQAQRAGLPVTGGEFIVLIVASTLTVTTLAFVVTLDMARGIAVGFLWLLFTVFYIHRKASKRMAAFDAQLGDCLVMMMNAIRAGFSFQQAMDTVVKEMHDPIATEFSRALKETQLGLPIEDALNGITQRIDSPDFNLVVTAVIIQRQVGGNLSQIIETIAATIRERVKLKGQIRALTAEGVMSGLVIGLMPLIMAAIITMMQPGYFDPLLKDPVGMPLIIYCIISECIGGYVIRRIIDVKV